MNERAHADALETIAKLKRELAAERDAHNATANNLGKALTRAEKAEAECERLREANAKFQRDLCQALNEGDGAYRP